MSEDQSSPHWVPVTGTLDSIHLFPVTPDNRYGTGQHKYLKMTIL